MRYSEAGSSATSACPILRDTGKAMRCMKLLQQSLKSLSSPLSIRLGRVPALLQKNAAKDGQSHKIFGKWPALRTPMIVVLIGEGCSGGALGWALAMSWRCSSTLTILSSLRRELRVDHLARQSKEELAAAALKLHPEDLMKFDIVDAMLEEPMGGAHHDPAQVYRSVKKYIIDQWNILKNVPPEVLIEQRYQKYRRIGKFAVET